MVADGLTKVPSESAMQTLISGGPDGACAQIPKISTLGLRKGVGFSKVARWLNSSGDATIRSRRREVQTGELRDSTRETVLDLRALLCYAALVYLSPR